MSRQLLIRHYLSITTFHLQETHISYLQPEDLQFLLPDLHLILEDLQHLLQAP